MVTLVIVLQIMMILALLLNVGSYIRIFSDIKEILRQIKLSIT